MSDEQTNGCCRRRYAASLKRQWEEPPVAYTPPTTEYQVAETEMKIALLGVRLCAVETELPAQLHSVVREELDATLGPLIQRN